MIRHLVCLPIVACCLLVAASSSHAAPPAQLPGTEPLTLEGDIAAQLVDGVDKFLLRKIDESVAGRAKYWKYDTTNEAALVASVKGNRERLAKILGVRDARVKYRSPEIITSFGRSKIVGRKEHFDVHLVRWPVMRDVFAEGLLLLPNKTAPVVADVIVLPDADQSPEEIAGLTGNSPNAMLARRLVANGCRVLIPILINRTMEKRNGRANLTNREFLYRPGFEMGRHLIGYEVQKVLAAVDWFAQESAKFRTKIGVVGYGEGGLTALYVGAIDTRIEATMVSGYFGSRQNVWQEPIDRNVFGLLREFGDAEVATLHFPRPLLIEAVKSPELTLPSEGGAPGRLVTPSLDEVKAEVARARTLIKGVTHSTLELFGDGQHGVGTSEALPEFLKLIAPGIHWEEETEPQDRIHAFIDPADRMKRAMYEIERDTQQLLAESSYTRAEFMKKLDTSSPEKYAATVEEYRKIFRDEIIGRFDEPVLPPKPRTRLAYDKEKWVGYEVVLDVWPEVIAYGILCLPKDIKAGEKRPVVVCQHGLEGRPQDIVTGDHQAYHDFAAKLAERGFITFAPQNLYIGRDRFRTLQRKANPLGCTLFSIIVPQHQQIVDWLKTLPQVDAKRIAFYGLSYGGKSAMRIPPLVPDYCLSICSADFNEWVWKNASTRAPYSYVWTNEYEIFEWDLGNTFNYAEMAALIAPRPFMVERGHFDGVAPDETVGYEFAKVRNLYAARLKLPPEHCQIEWFVGPHTINGQGTFQFLHRHLDWPEPK